MEERFLVCLPVFPGFRAATLSLKEKCFRCGTEVWKALSSPNEKIVCLECAAILLKERYNHYTILPPSPEQRRDIEGNSSGNN